MKRRKLYFDFGIDETTTTLDLYRNKIGSEGAMALAEALKPNYTLTHLDLYYNTIGSEGAMALAEALKTNYTLTHLNLYYNKIGSEGAKALIEALECNCTLTTLDLESNSINHEDRAQILDLCNRNKALRKQVRDRAVWIYALLRKSRLACKDMCGIIAKAVWRTRGNPEWLVNKFAE
jgi:Ran GTPase-activating protein (RanGAP) involved in mRNA processing and transport